MYLVSCGQRSMPAAFGQLGKRFGFKQTTLADLPAASVQTDILVVDLSLADAAQTRTKMESFRKHKCPRIFLVDKSSHLETAQAWAAGASHVVDRDRSGPELCALVSRHMREQAERVTATMLETLSTTFQAVARDEPVSHAQIDRSAQELVAAVGSTGVAHWLNLCWQIDEATSQHCMLVAGITAGFTHALGLSSKDRRALTHAAIVHDVGKAKISPAILNKPGALNSEERAEINRHPVLGWSMLTAQDYGDAAFRDAVLHHHEYLDGSGYPFGLAGTSISDFVRIITLCDIYGALRERRSYKPVLSTQAALARMHGLEGKLDPDLLREFSAFARAARQEDEAPKAARPMQARAR